LRRGAGFKKGLVQRRDHKSSLGVGSTGRKGEKLVAGESVSKKGGRLGPVGFWLIFSGKKKHRRGELNLSEKRRKMKVTSAWLKLMLAEK